MRKCLKAVAVSIALLMVVSAAASCGKGISEVEKIKKSGKLVVLTNAEFPPYEYMNGDNVPVGVDMEIAKSIADALGVELQVKSMNFAEIVPALASGKGNLAIAAISPTDKRKESVDFSTSYVTSSLYIIVRAGEEEIAGADALKGTVIGVQKETAEDFYATDEAMAKSVQRFATVTEAAAALKEGKVDAVIAEELTARKLVADNAEALKVVEAPLTQEPYAVAVKKNSDLLEVVNGVIGKLVADGTVETLMLKYTTAALPDSSMQN